MNDPEQNKDGVIVSTNYKVYFVWYTLRCNVGVRPYLQSPKTNAALFINRPWRRCAG